MFTKKNDPVVDSVKSVMRANEIRRQVEDALNEQFGVSSRKAIPHEQRREYDNLLEEAYKCAMKEEDAPEYKGTGTGSGMFDPKHGGFHVVGPDGYTVMVSSDKADAERIAKKYGKGHKVVPAEKFKKSVKESKEGSVPNTAREKALAAKYGNPNRITKGDVVAARIASGKKKGMKEATEPTAPVKNEPTKDNPPLTNRSGWRTTVNKEEAIDENALIRAVGTALARNASRVPKVPGRELVPYVAKDIAKSPSMPTKSEPNMGFKVPSQTEPDVTEKPTKSSDNNKVEYTRLSSGKFVPVGGGDAVEGGVLGFNSKDFPASKTYVQNPDWHKYDNDPQFRFKPTSPFSPGIQDNLQEKAVSKAQHRFFGLVRGIQKGQAHGSAKAEKAAKEMSTKEVRKFAKTKEKGLPEKVHESANSIMEEIRANLEEKLVAAYESGDQHLEAFVNSLNEEQLELLGLNEALGNVFDRSGPDTSILNRAAAQTYSNQQRQAAGQRTVSVARPAPAARPAAPAPAAPTARPAPAPAARPAPGTSAPAARPAAQQYGPRQASSDMGAPPAGSPQYSGAQQHATSDLTPTPSFTPPAPTKLDPLTTGSVKGLGQAMGKRPDAGSSPATQKQTTQDLKKSGFDDTKQSSGAAYSGAGLFESLETYLRNKFIKG